MVVPTPITFLFSLTTISSTVDDLQGLDEEIVSTEGPHSLGGNLLCQMFSLASHRFEFVQGVLS